MIKNCNFSRTFFIIYTFVFFLKIPRLFLGKNLLLNMSMFSYVLLFLICVLVLWKDFFENIVWIVQNKLKSILIVILGYIGINLANVVSFLIITQVRLEATLTNDLSIAQAFKLFPPIVCILIFGIMGPIVEEFFYRKLIITSFTRWFSPWLAITISSALFSIAHLSGGINIEGIILIIPHFFSGIVLGIIFRISDNLLFPIVLHIILNLMALLPLIG